MIKKKKNTDSCLIPLILLRARFWRSKIRNSVSFWYVASSICLYALMCVRNFYHSIHVSNLDRYPSCSTHSWYNTYTSSYSDAFVIIVTNAQVCVWYLVDTHFKTRSTQTMNLVSLDLTSISSFLKENQTNIQFLFAAAYSAVPYTIAGFINWDSWERIWLNFFILTEKYGWT